MILDVKHPGRNKVLNQCDFSGLRVHPETLYEVYTVYTLTMCPLALKCSSSVLLLHLKCICSVSKLCKLGIIV